MITISIIDGTDSLSPLVPPTAAVRRNKSLPAGKSVRVSDECHTAS